MIESDKGWSTKEILGLPLCRARQVAELISQDRRDELKVQTMIVEWQTKNLAAMFGVIARDSKQSRAIAKVVKGMNLPLADEDVDVKGRELNVVEGEVQVSTVADLEDDESIDFDSQPSFEDLMSAFGDLQQEEITE